MSVSGHQYAHLGCHMVHSFVYVLLWLAVCWPDCVPWACEMSVSRPSALQAPYPQSSSANAVALAEEVTIIVAHSSAVATVGGGPAWCLVV